VTEADGSRVDYTYDDLYRLTGETRTGTHAYTISYTYDNVGNRLTQNKDGQITTYVYNNRDQLTTETTGTESTSHEYDASGRLIHKTNNSGTTTYSWLDNERMASVTSPTGTVTYEYNADGLKIKTDDGSNPKWYLYDMHLPYGQVIAEYSNDGSLIAGYVYGQERISQKRGTVVHFYIADGQGSIRQLTDVSGTVTDEYWYTAFGETLARTGTTINEFQYVGEQWDPNAGFYYLRARWYDPENGRFVSVDPWEGDPQAPVSLHRYLYGNDSPAQFIDPSGNMTLTQVMAMIAILYVAIPVTVSYIGFVEDCKDNIVGFNASHGIQKLVVETHMASAALAVIVTTTWPQVISKIWERIEEIKEKLRKQRKKWRADLLETGPSVEYGAKYNNWENPIQMGINVWYRDGGPRSGRLYGFGIFNHLSGIGSHMPIARLDLHPIGDAYGGKNLLHVHVGNQDDPHYVIGIFNGPK